MKYEQMKPLQMSQNLSIRDSPQINVDEIFDCLASTIFGEYFSFFFFFSFLSSFLNEGLVLGS